MITYLSHSQAKVLGRMVEVALEKGRPSWRGDFDDLEVRADYTLKKLVKVGAAECVGGHPKMYWPKKTPDGFPVVVAMDCDRSELESGQCEMLGGLELTAGQSDMLGEILDKYWLLKRPITTRDLDQSRPGWTLDALVKAGVLKCEHFGSRAKIFVPLKSREGRRFSLRAKVKK